MTPSKRFLKKKTIDKQVSKYDPVEPPDYVAADVEALRAVNFGRATPEQQTRAMEYIVNELCGTYASPFREDSGRVTAFACGKQHIGQMLVWLMKAAPITTREGEKP